MLYRELGSISNLHMASPYMCMQTCFYFIFLRDKDITLKEALSCTTRQGKKSQAENNTQPVKKIQIEGIASLRHTARKPWRL